MEITGNIKSMHARVYVSLGWAKGKLGVWVRRGGENGWYILNKDACRRSLNVLQAAEESPRTRKRRG